MNWVLPRRPYVHLVDAEQKVDYTGRLKWYPPDEALLWIYYGVPAAFLPKEDRGAINAIAESLRREQSQFNPVYQRLSKGFPVDPPVAELVYEHGQYVMVRSDGQHRAAAAYYLKMRVPVAEIEVDE